MNFQVRRVPLQAIVWILDLVRRTQCAAGTSYYSTGYLSPLLISNAHFPHFISAFICLKHTFVLEFQYPDPKEIQINITGFLNSKNARIFLSELWDLLLSAMQDPEGVPAALIEAKKMEIASRQVRLTFDLDLFICAFVNFSCE